MVHVDENVKRKWQSPLWIRACLQQKRNQSRKNSVTCLLIQTSDPEAVIMEKGRDWGSPTPIPAMVNMSGLCPFSTRYETFPSSSSEAIPLTSEGFCCCHAPSLSIPLFRLHCTHLDLYIVRLQLLASNLLWFSNWDKLPKNNKSLIVLFHPGEKTQDKLQSASTDTEGPSACNYKNPFCQGFHCCGQLPLTFVPISHLWLLLILRYTV